MQQRTIRYELKIVGGPYVGIAGLKWLDDGEHPPPAVILIGICAGDGRCFDDVKLCHSRGGGRPHTAYWQEDEPECPDEAARYLLDRNYLHRLPDGHLIGVAEYVVPGLRLPESNAAVESFGTVAAVHADGRITVELGV